MPAWVDDQLYPLLPTAINVPREASRKPGAGAARHTRAVFLRQAFSPGWPTRHPVGAVGVPSYTLFLEATQLKTVRMVTTVLRVDSAEMKVQAVGNASRGERRPAEPIATDVTQRTGAVTAAARGRGRSALESWSWLGNKLKLPLRRAGGASRHSALAIRARKQSLSARWQTSFREPAEKPKINPRSPQSTVPAVPMPPPAGYSVPPPHDPGRASPNPDPTPHNRNRHPPSRPVR